MSWFKKKQEVDEIDMPCPRDGKIMKKRVIGDVIIDVCPKCRGIWLDDEEIDKLIEHAHKMGLDKKNKKKKTTLKKGVKKKNGK